MSRLHAFLLAAVAALLVAVPPARAAPPQVMTYSGYLKAAGGAPVTAATTLTFRLYTAAAGGSPVWSETVSVTPGSDGWFAAVIGTTSPLPFDVLNQDLYLSLQVNTDAEFPERARVTPSHSALTVDWGGVQGKPTCAAGAYLTLDSAGALLCTPPGPGGAVTSVSGTPGGFVTAATAAGAVSLSLTGCAVAGQILQWDGAGWQCAAAPSSGFTPPTCASAGQVLQWDGTAWRCAADASGLAAVAVAAPLAGDGTPGAPVSLGAASAISSGYVTAADYVAFGAKAPSPGAGCLPNEVLTWTGAAFSCVADQNSGGTVTGVSAAPGSPISVATGGTTPVIGITRADAAGTAGYITSADYVAFSGKAPSPGAGCLPNEVLTWTGAAFSCVADQNSGGTVTAVTAGAGLTGGGTSGALGLGVSFTASGGTNGTATTVARGDHSHPLVTTIPLSDFAPSLGTATLGPVTLATYVSLPAWTIATASACIVGSTRIPPGMGGPTGAMPVIKVLAASQTTMASYIVFGNSGLVVGSPMPTGTWAAPGPISTSFTANTLVELSNGLNQGSFQVTGSNPAVYAGAGDTFVVRFCAGAAGIQIFRVTLIWS